MAKPTFNPTSLMMLAIKAMKESVKEPRNDGKSNPLVGAVIWKPDGEYDMACRGELRWGDHAEFTLLERKNRDQKLDGTALFTTLEPCAPGARNHPKLSCAERIVLARIKEVWVGIEDPDPMVDRKGIKYLQDNGVTVHLFDRDLQEQIRQANLDFILQAMERAQASRQGKKPKIVKLSSFENAYADSKVEDFSPEALQRFREIAKIKDELGSADFNRRLVRQGLLKQDNDKYIPTGFGLLLFGKEPRTSLPQAGLLGTIHYPDGKEETRDFDGPLVLIPPQVEQWLRDKLPIVLDRNQMQRREAPSVPFEMIREAVVNALIHRDYENRRAKCQLVVTENTIAVMSPGGPLSPITLEQLQSFSAPMLSRNPELHYVFARMEMAEERGLGIKTLKNHAQQVQLPLPKYAWEDPYLVLTIFRSQEAAARTLGTGILNSLTESEKAGWEWLVTKGKTKTKPYSGRMKVDVRTAQRHLSHFVELGLVKKTGSGPSTEYEVV
jgi:ATP-dependent DNA helicase RecG